MKKNYNNSNGNDDNNSNEKERKRSKTQEKPELPNTVVHHPLTHLIPQQPQTGPNPLVSVLGRMFHGMEYPSGQSRSVLLAMLPPSSLCPCSLAEPGKLKSP